MLWTPRGHSKGMYNTPVPDGLFETSLTFGRSTMDPELSLDEINRRASRKGINLKEEVIRERAARRGGCATVYRGKLSPSGTLVAIKTATGGVPGDEKIIKVRYGCSF